MSFDVIRRYRVTISDCGHLNKRIYQFSTAQLNAFLKEMLGAHFGVEVEALE